MGHSFRNLMMKGLYILLIFVLACSVSAKALKRRKLVVVKPNPKNPLVVKAMPVKAVTMRECISDITNCLEHWKCDKKVNAGGFPIHKTVITEFFCNNCQSAFKTCW